MNFPIHGTNSTYQWHCINHPIVHNLFIIIFIKLNSLNFKTLNSLNISCHLSTFWFRLLKELSRNLHYTLFITLWISLDSISCTAHTWFHVLSFLPNNLTTPKKWGWKEVGQCYQLHVAWMTRRCEGKILIFLKLDKFSYTLC